VRRGSKEGRCGRRLWDMRKRIKNDSRGNNKDKLARRSEDIKP
jgi:hypothetical protein